MIALYLQSALALTVVGFVGIAIWLVLRTRPEWRRPRRILALQWCLLAGACASPWLPTFREASFRFEAPVKVYASTTEHHAVWEEMASPVLGTTLSSEASLPVDAVNLVLGDLLLVFLGLWGRRLFRLARLVRNTVPLRACGRVRILVSEEVSGPLSLWFPGRALVLLPAWILEDPVALRIGVRHELQHHRAGDTRTAYVLTLLQVLYFWNPLLPKWGAVIQELQEMSCDEALLGQGISVRDYNRCLFEVAQRSFACPAFLAGTPGFAWSIAKGHLTRRFEHMKQSTQGTKKSSWSLGLATLVAIGATTLASWGAQAVVRDARISLAEAQEMAERARGESPFPIVVNEVVLEQLNRYVSTPDGREFIRASLERMEERKAAYAPIFEKYNAPEELYAVPVVESGYRNLSAGENPLRAAGVWQFICRSARDFGLRCDNQHDDRMDERKSTDAALRYLTGSKLRFDDWLLGLMAYNAGEGAVQKAIDATGSRDAFALRVGDTRYLAKVMAVILILKNPDLLN